MRLGSPPEERRRPARHAKERDPEPAHPRIALSRAQVAEHPVSEQPNRGEEEGDDGADAGALGRRGDARDDGAQDATSSVIGGMSAKTIRATRPARSSAVMATDGQVSGATIAHQMM